MTRCWQDSPDICPQRFAVHAPPGLQEKAVCGKLLSRGTLLKYAQGGGCRGSREPPCAAEPSGEPGALQGGCPANTRTRQKNPFLLQYLLNTFHKKLNTMPAGKRKKLKGPDSFLTKQAKSLNLELNP